MPDLSIKIENLGVSSSALYALQKWREKLMRPNALLTLTSRYALYPLKARAHTSDISAFSQIFVEREYCCLDEVIDADLIIDCGAYVGYSSAYFLSRFPQCSLIAIEPDPQNFELLATNLSPYENRARIVRAGVWSHQSRLVMSESRFGDGREWSRQVRECRPDEYSNLTGLDLGGILEESGHKNISILKVDIEGAEAVVFSHNYESWIEKVDNIVIELHRNSRFGNATDTFMNAIEGRDFVITRCGELTCCQAAQEHAAISS
jgi:FkbM family methyltransferase